MNYYLKYSDLNKRFIKDLNEKEYENINTFFNKLIDTALPRGFIGEASEDILWQRHILDSLLILQSQDIIKEFKSFQYIVDLGSGAGLPGMVLSFIFPEKKFFLVEAMQKRCAFLNETVESMSLKNIEIINSRVEDLKPEMFPDKPSLVLFRAFLKPLVSLELSLNVLRQNSKVLYWRSRRFDISEPEAKVEIEKRIKNLGFKIEKFETLKCPEELGSRGFYLFQYNGKPQKGFPRNWAKIKNDSLGNRVI